MKLPRFHQKGHAYYYVTRGTRKWIPLGSDLAAAIRQYHKLEAQQAPGGTALELVYELIEDRRGDLTPGTIAQYMALADHLRHWFGDDRPADIGRSDVLEYLDTCPRTSGKAEISLLRQALERAVRRRLIDANPCVGAKAERPRVSRRTRYVSDAELAAIRAAGAPLLRVALDLAYLTGLRPGDLCRLRWDDFAPDGHVRTAKTGARARYTLTDDLAAVLDAARALAPRVGTLAVLSERGRPVTRHRIGDLFRAAARAAGVGDVQLRDVRAKAATDADAGGQDAQRLLGHTTPQTTRTYLRGRRIVTVDPVRRVKS